VPLIELSLDDRYNLRQLSVRNCSRVTYRVVVLFLFLSRAITLGGYPLREDLGGDLSGTQLKPGNARDPSPMT